MFSWLKRLFADTPQPAPWRWEIEFDLGFVRVRPGDQQVDCVHKFFGRLTPRSWNEACRVLGRWRAELVIFAGPVPPRVADRAVAVVPLVKMRLVDGRGSGFVRRTGVASFARLYDVNGEPFAQMQVSTRKKKNSLQLDTTRLLAAVNTVDIHYVDVLGVLV